MLKIMPNWHFIPFWQTAIRVQFKLANVRRCVEGGWMGNANNRIRDWRLSKQLDQRELAAMLKVSQSCVGRYEKSTRGVPMDIWHALAKALKCRGVDLMSANDINDVLRLFTLEASGLSASVVDRVQRVVNAPIGSIMNPAESAERASQVGMLLLEPPEGAAPPKEITIAAQRVIKLYHIERRGGAFIIDEARSSEIARPPSLADPAGYAVIVGDDSMAPRYRSGQTIYVDTVTAPLAGSGVVVRAQDGRAKIREWSGWLSASEGVATVYQPQPAKEAINGDDQVHLIVGVVEV